MGQELEIHLIKQVHIAEFDRPDLMISAGDLLVELWNGMVICTRYLPRADVERAIRAIEGTAAEDCLAAMPRVPEDDPDGRLLVQVMEELERRWPDLVRSRLPG